MKTKQILLGIGITSMLILGACASNTQKDTKQTATEIPEGIYYTCTMHPDVHSDKPGNCPICGMELVKKENAMTDSTMTEHSMEGMSHN